MDKNKRDLIELILDKLKEFNSRSSAFMALIGAEYSDGNNLENILDIGYRGIPMILQMDECDYFDELLCDYLGQKITKEEYLENLEECLKGE